MCTVDVITYDELLTYKHKYTEDLPALKKYLINNNKKFNKNDHRPRWGTRMKEKSNENNINVDIRSLLNKLSENTLDNTITKIKELKIDDLNFLVKLVYQKAVSENNFTELYAKLCIGLQGLEGFNDLLIGMINTNLNTVSDKFFANGLMTFIGYLYNNEYLSDDYVKEKMTYIINDMENDELKYDMVLSLFKVSKLKNSDDIKMKLLLKMPSLNKKNQFIVLDIINLLN
jgi:hypothetical protein